MEKLRCSFPHTFTADVTLVYKADETQLAQQLGGLELKVKCLW